ncbi:phage tail protein [Vibrio cyclitrophicus]|uniref:phage tail-collar fiber domain-containing protein n=1 Tax=Vibrio cyclitrophicus TaxID=47951 RepID=UPI000CCB1D1D|nr:phage tail protein [Vibrio cyclitrophicus]PMF18929.1 hypothetical protein BCV24_10755 [Vibrio cyclitrophicus]
MANVTDKSILTAAGKALLAQLNAEEKPLVIDKMIFANVPNRPEYPQPDDVVPSNNVVHEAAVEQRGRLSVDSVIYSTTLTSQEGPFEFNWTGAYCSEYGVLVTIDHHALTPKTADEPGVAGNTLVRSVVLEYKDIAEITNITVDASTWQYNATPRMKKMDDDVAQANIDQNGKDWFIEDGFLVTPQASAFNIKAGAGYVSGNRVSLEFDRNVQVPNKPSFIYVDAHREGTPTGEQITLFDFMVTAEEKDDYTDANDVKHFVCKVAKVLANGSVSDLRPEGVQATKGYVSDIAGKHESQVVEGDVYPTSPHQSIKVGDKIPARTSLVRVDGKIVSLNKTILSEAIVTAIHGTLVNVGESPYKYRPKLYGTLDLKEIDERVYDDGVDAAPIFLEALKRADYGMQIIFSGESCQFDSAINFNLADVTGRVDIDFRRCNIRIPADFPDTTVFNLGFLSDYRFFIDSGFDNLHITFDDAAEVIDVFDCEKIARITFKDYEINNLKGTVFSKTSVGHEITGENLYVRSADVENDTGIYINFTDSYFTNLKPIGFSEFGIVNAGPDNRYYGCHPWSFPRSNPQYSHMTTKILIYDKEDGMWTDCYADTFERKDSVQPPSFSNGGIGYFFDKVSGIARMSNCGFYALDTSKDSLIGIAAKSTVQQINVSGGYMAGSNPDAYLKFVHTETTGTAVNLWGCNFSEEQYQAKEQVIGSALVSKTETYIKTLDPNQFNTFNSALKTWKPRRNDYAALTFKDDGESTDMYYWDINSNQLEQVLKRSQSVVVINSLSTLGITNANAPTTKPEFFKAIVDAVELRGLIPCKFMVRMASNTYGDITANIFPYPCVFEGSLVDENTFVITAQKFAAAGVSHAAYERYSNTFHEWN